MKRAKVLLTAFVVLTAVGGALAFKASRGIATTLYTVVGANNTCSGTGTSYFTTTGTGTNIQASTTSGGTCKTFKTTTTQE